MNVIWQSKQFQAANVLSTYARLYVNGEVKFYDVDRRHKTIREYWTPLADVSDEIRVKLRPGEQVLVAGLTMQERQAK